MKSKENNYSEQRKVQLNDVISNEKPNDKITFIVISYDN